MSERLNIFISSTSKDLLAYRDRVRDIIIQAGHFPIMMEDFNPSDANALQTCYDRVRESDAFIGIYAYRYGYVPGNEMQYRDASGHVRRGDGYTSVTRWEYQWADELGLPRFLYLLDDESDSARNWPPEFIDSDPDASRLKDFKDFIMSHHTVRFFGSPDSLGVEVAMALPTLPGTRVEALKSALREDDYLSTIRRERFSADFISEFIFDAEGTPDLRERALELLFNVYPEQISSQQIAAFARIPDDGFRSSLRSLIVRYNIPISEDVLAEIMTSQSVDLAVFGVRLAKNLVEQGKFTSAVFRHVCDYKAGDQTWRVTRRAVGAIVNADDADSFETLLLFTGIRYQPSVKDALRYLETLHKQQRLSPKQRQQALELLERYLANPKMTSATKKMVNRTKELLTAQE